MIDAKTRDKVARSEVVSLHLRRLAKRADPENGYLLSLAEFIDVHQTTISAWVAQGYVPLFQVRKMQKKFGRKHVPLNELCPEEFRSV